MRCNTSAAVLLREARARHGISQQRLALRAGTSQDAISRIERGVESPTVERLAHLLMVLGERLELGAVPRAEGKADSAQLTVRERLREAASWNLVATQLEIAGAQARRAGHPATRVEGSRERHP
ncbi:MAG TPA: helix-turn-helix transcriptional regulator [Solirubrobacteraceae bacterium]|jgi:transcriptional regulator with XRE-family HTH domain|nr:helix-turn-helix transcriptional regulator [Solirubrobacteraceae bacterium]